MNNKDFFRNLISIFLIFLVFVLVSFFVQRNIFYIELMIGEVPFLFSALTYFLLAFVTTVVAPLTSVPLMPVATSLWGWKITAFLSILSWSLGSLVAFFIARKLGKPFIRRFVSIKKIEKFEDKIPKKNMFWTIVFLRIVIPADVLSYALGIFSKIGYGTYTWATIVGISPFAILLSYAGDIDIKAQFVMFLAFLFVLLIFYFLQKKKR